MSAGGGPARARGGPDPARASPPSPERPLGDPADGEELGSHRAPTAPDLPTAPDFAGQQPPEAGFRGVLPGFSPTKSGRSGREEGWVSA